MKSIAYRCVLAVLAALLTILSAPSGFAAGPGEGPTYAQVGPTTGQPVGPGLAPGAGAGPPAVEAFVIGVDPPDNCLRVRRGPSPSYQVVGCAKQGDRLRLTGVFSGDNKWAQLEDNGWVYACQIRTDFKPPGPPVDCGRAVPSSKPRAQGSWSEPAGFGEVVVPRYIEQDRGYGGNYWRYQGHGHGYGHGHGHGHGHGGGGGGGHKK